MINATQSGGTQPGTRIIKKDTGKSNHSARSQISRFNLSFDESLAPTTVPARNSEESNPIAV